MAGHQLQSQLFENSAYVQELVTCHGGALVPFSSDNELLIVLVRLTMFVRL